VGLLGMGRSLQRDLNRIAEAADTSTLQSHKTKLSLLRHPDYCISGYSSVVVILLTEIIPKSIAVHNAIAVARAVVHPVAWLSIVLYRVGRVVTFLSMGMLKILGLKAKRIRFSMHYQVVLGCSVPWSNERPLKNKELNAIIGVWFTLWRD
ncbi:putative DUF21 domain-containing protein, chloroplastic, partial [Tanacetum coccineum]